MNQLQTCQTTKDLIYSCYEIFNKSIYVHRGKNTVKDMVDLISQIRSWNKIGWEWLVSDINSDHGQIAFEFAFNSALNGGYFYQDGENTISQWQIDGSGSQALTQWIAELKAQKMFPGIQTNDVNLLLPFVTGLPFEKDRYNICQRFCLPETRMEIRKLIESCFVNGEYSFSLDNVIKLQSIVPEAFSEDPFKKKAILCFLLLTGFLISRGFKVSYDLPIPSDYQIPRILTWLGMLSVTEEFQNRLLSNKLLNVQSQMVIDYRAAAIVLCHELSVEAGVPNFVVDGALFSSFRKNAMFIQESLPPMKCDSLWF